MASYTPEQIQGAIENARAAGDENAVRSLQAALSGAMREQARVMGRGPIRQVMQGATFGLGEEIEAGLTGRPVEEIRGEMTRYREAAPVAAVVLELAGGLGPGVGLGAGLARAGRAGRTLTAPTITGQGALGGLEGAAYGAGTGETPVERARRALVGAGLGAVTGGTLTPVAGMATRRFRPGMEAERRVEGAIRRDIGRAPSAQDFGAMAARGEAQPEITLAETAGAELEDLARTSASMAGGRQVAEEALNQRTRAMSDRLISTLEETAGTGKQYWSNIRELERQAKTDAAPLYETAYRLPLAFDDELAELTARGLETGELRRGYEGARRHAMLREGEKLPPWAQLVGEEGDITQLGIREYDWMKRGLDARYKQLVSKDPASAAAIWSYRQQLVDKLDRLAPDYRAARRLYAGPMAQKDAQEAGRKIFKEDAEYTEEFIRDLSQAEKDAYIVGAVQAVRDKLKGVPPEGGMPRFTQLAFDRLRNAFPDDTAYTRFVDALLQEREMQRFRNQILSGSPTARIQASQEEAGRALGPVSALLSGDVGEAARRTVGALMPRSRATIPEYINDPLARMLFAQGAQIPAELRRLQRPAIMPRLLPPITTTEAAILSGQIQPRQ